MNASTATGLPHEVPLDVPSDPPPNPPLDDVPGQGAFGPLVDAFDERIDRLLERLRGNSVADKVFTTASHVGEFSMASRDDEMDSADNGSPAGRANGLDWPSGEIRTAPALSAEDTDETG